MGSGVPLLCVPDNGCPFVQGTATHFGSHKEQGERLRRGIFAALQPLIDFFGFGLQAAIFVLLASEIERPSWFVGVLFSLLAFDVVWIAGTLKLDQEAKVPLFRAVLQQWGASNLIFGLTAAAVWYVPSWDVFYKAALLLAFSVIAAGLDYWCNREFYFGKVQP